MTWSVSLYVGWLVGLTEIISLKRREVSLFHAPIGALVLLRIKAWRKFCFYLSTGLTNTFYGHL